MSFVYSSAVPNRSGSSQAGKSSAHGNGNMHSPPVTGSGSGSEHGERSEVNGKSKHDRRIMRWVGEILDRRRQAAGGDP